MSKKFSVPRGTTDILPWDISLWRKIEKVSRDVLKTYNYQEIRTPLFEETELFARSMGQTSDVVQKQMLNLASQRKDEDGKPKLSGFALRPENTASVVRSYIENNLDKKERLSKIFYIGPMFRGERPQKGRLRQFHQIGAEAIGPDSLYPFLDAEVIALSVNILKKLGLTNFELNINTLGSQEDKKNFSAYLRKSLKSSKEALCEDCQSRYERNVFRILDCKDKTCRRVVDQIDLDYSFLAQESQKYFDKVKQTLDALNIAYQVTPRLVRGLDYYTHTVFEITDSSLGSQDALGAGGRYNDLVSQLGGPQVDAIGFALGIERILLAMPQENKPCSQSLDAFIVVLDERAMIRGFQIIDMLRAKNVSCDISYRRSSMKSQMRQANKLSAKFVLILGEKELAKDVATVKDMESGEQKEFSIQKTEFNVLVEKLLEG